MSSLWTPDGERPVRRDSPGAADAPDGPPAGVAPDGSEGGDAGVPPEVLRQAAEAMGLDLDALDEQDRAQLRAELAEMLRVRRELAEQPAAEVLVNHVQRFFDLVLIYLEAEPPRFTEAATVIEGLRGLVEGVGDRFGQYTEVTHQVVAQAQMLFVQVKEQQAGAE
ncbi:MAG: hypothetical protein ACOYOP_13990 [Microthrixaceae bacterium]